MTVTTTTDELGLIAAVCAAPDDDTPRLVLADWLDENGRPDRARLIRMQVRRDRYRPPRVSVRRWFSPWWTGPSNYSFCNPAWDMLVYRRQDGGSIGAGGSPGCLLVRRGFVDEIRLPTADFVAHAAALFAAHPVTGVTLADREPEPHVATILGWRSDFGVPAPDATPAVLPAALYDLLPITADCDPEYPIGYPTREAALAALSVACVRHGRSRAGLPALTTVPA